MGEEAKWLIQLLTAAKLGKDDYLQRLLTSTSFIDVNLKDKNGYRAVDYAWNGRHFKFVLSLLKNDSVFPDRFDLNHQNNDKDGWEDLKKFVEERNQLHTYVKDGNFDQIRTYCPLNKSKFYLNSDNETLLLTAIKHKKCVIFHFLLSIGVEHLSKDEKCNADEFITKSVNENSKDFVIYFVQEIEAKLHFYNLVLEGKIEKAGEFSDTFSKGIGQGIGGAMGGLLGLALGVPGVGARLGAAGGDTLGEKIGSKIGKEHHKKKVITVMDLIYRFQNDKADFRRKLVEDGFDIFQSYEMPFMKVTTNQGPKKAMQLLARDAADRIISYYEENKYFEGQNVIEGIVLGKSKIQPVYGVPIPSAKIKTRGFTIDPIDSSKKDWSTASLYKKVGLVREDVLYEKKDGTSKVDKYGYRRFLNSEDWNKLKSEYKPSELKAPFKSYQFILSSENLDSQKITENILKEINMNDKGLMEKRITELIKETTEEIKTLKEQSQGHTEDLKILANIEAILQSLKVNEYFEEISINVSQLKQKIDVYCEETRNLTKKLLHNKRTEEKIWFDVKDPVNDFTGRERELSELHSKIQRNPEKSTVITHLTTISGLGGVGKTELARRYIQEYGKDFDNVLWINSESETTLIESFSKLANKLLIETKCENGKEKNIKHIAEDVYAFLSKRKSLFIFDNAERDNKLVELLSTFRRSLAPPCVKPYILITSRIQEWEKGIEIFNLNVLTPQDAADLVRKRIQAEDKEIQAIIEKLQCFPLALQQAIVYIEDQQVYGEYSISDYLEEYEKKTEELLDADIFRNIDNDYEKTTFTTWKITIDKIEKQDYGKLSKDILNTMSYLAPDNIEREMFLMTAKNDERKLKLAVRLLVKYSMIYGEQKQNILSIHRLVQEVIRLELKGRNQEEKVLKEVLELIEENFPYGSDTLEDCAKKRRQLPHLEAFRSHIDEWIKKKPQDISKIEKDFLENLLTWMGHGYEDLGDPQRKKELLERALAIQEKHYGSEHFKLAVTLENLGNAYGALGDPQKRKELLERALAIQEKHYGSDHFQLAVTLGNLGTAYGTLGDPQKKKELLERALAIQEKHSGSENFQIAATLGNLGNAYGELGDPQKQKELLERALAIKEKQYGSEHFQVAATLVNLGNAYGNLGDPQKKKELLEKALAIQEKHYGSEHFELAVTLVNLGNANGDLGNPQKEKGLLERALAIQEKHYGSEHFEVATTLVNLGSAYGTLGDPQKKKELLERALAIQEKHYGSDHFQLAATLGNLGTAYGTLGDPQKKKELLERALAIQEKHSGSENFQIAATLGNLGNAYGKLGDPQKRKELLERALAIDEKHYGSEHFKVAATLRNLGDAYGELGDPQKQKKLLERVLAIQEKHYGSEHFQVAATLGNLGYAYGELGDPRKQKELLERALAIQEKHYGSDHFQVAGMLGDLGNAYGDLGDPQKKKELLEKALAIQEKHYGSNHFQVAAMLVNLGNAYGNLGDPQKKKELLERALAIKEKHYGSEHFQVAATLVNLGNAYGNLGDPQKKKELLEKALAIQEKHYGSEHFQVAKTLGNLGNAYKDLGDPRKKMELLERALGIEEKHYGSDHFQVATTLVNLGTAYGDLGDAQKKKELLERALAILKKHYGL